MSENRIISGLRDVLAGATTERRDAAYWRNAYETLVDQTGRDLNDGLGRDPRRDGRYATSGRAPTNAPSSVGVDEAVTKANAAISAAHDLIANGMTIKGMVCISSVDLFGWTIKHAAAINSALSVPPSVEGG